MTSVQAVLLSALPLTPIIASILTMASFSLSPDASASWLLGPWATNPLLAILLYLLLTWLVLGLISLIAGWTDADYVNPIGYGDLCDRSSQLHARIEALPVQANLAKTYSDAIDRSLRSRSPNWILGCGYINLLKRIHRAEEALIDVEPVEDLIADARYDQLRYGGAAIQNPLIDERLTQAIDFLRRVEIDPNNGQSGERRIDVLASSGDQSTADQPDRYAASSASNAQSVVAVRVVDHKPLQESCGSLPSSISEARQYIRQARLEINTYRDQRRAGLVRARNRLAMTSVLAGLTLYALLWQQILGHVSQETVGAAAAYFLLGSIVGLFNRLRLDVESEAGVDDYGLSIARLLVTPLLSGIAAIGGVMLIAILTMTHAASGNGASELERYVQLSGHPFNLVIAAVFGLTPALLTERLNQQVDQLKQELASGRTAKS